MVLYHVVRYETGAGIISAHDRDGRWQYCGRWIDERDSGERRVVDGAWVGEAVE